MNTTSIDTLRLQFRVAVVAMLASLTAMIAAAVLTGGAPASYVAFAGLPMMAIMAVQTRRKLHAAQAATV